MPYAIWYWHVDVHVVDWAVARCPQLHMPYAIWYLVLALACARAAELNGMRSWALGG
jgi:hypothetical protein